MVLGKGDEAVVQGEFAAGGGGGEGIVSGAFPVRKKKIIVKNPSGAILLSL